MIGLRWYTGHARVRTMPTILLSRDEYRAITGESQQNVWNKIGGLGEIRGGGQMTLTERVRDWRRENPNATRIDVKKYAESQGFSTEEHGEFFAEWFKQNVDQSTFQQRVERWGEKNP